MFCPVQIVIHCELSEHVRQGQLTAIHLEIKFYAWKIKGRRQNLEDYGHVLDIDDVSYGRGSEFVVAVAHT